MRSRSNYRAAAALLNEGTPGHKPGDLSHLPRPAVSVGHEKPRPFRAPLSVSRQLLAVISGFWRGRSVGRYDRSLGRLIGRSLGRSAMPET